MASALAPELIVREYRDLSSAAHTTTHHDITDGFVRSAVDARGRWFQYDYDEQSANQPFVIIAHELQTVVVKRN